LTICSETRQLKDTVLNLQAATGVTDQTHYGNDGTYQGGMGVVDGAFEFDGTDDRIDVDNSVFDTSGRTVSLWFYVDSLQSSMVFAGGTGSPNRFYMYPQADGTIDTRVGTNAAVTSSIGYTTGQWVHYVVVYDGAEVVVYINGEEGSRETNSTLSGSSQVNFGSFNRGASDRFDGSMRDLRIISRGITATEVRELYNATARPDIAGTVLHLRPETGLVDQSGTQDPASFNGGASIIGRRFNFDGIANSYISSQQALSGDFSASAWVRSDDTSSFTIMSSRINSIGTSQGFDLYQDSTGGAIQFDGYNNGRLFAIGTVVPTAGEWYHVCATWDAATLTATLYINGVSDASSVEVTAIAHSTELTIGAWNGGTSSFVLNGDLDDIRLMDNALTATQVLELYEGVPGYQPPLPVRQIPDTVLHLESASGERDLSNHCNYGTFEGTNIEEDSTDDLFAFNGTDDSLDMADSSVADVLSPSVSLWFKTSGAGSGFRGLCVKPNHFGIYLNSDELGFYDWTGAAFRGSGQSFTDDKWHHVVVVYRDGVSSGSDIFIDGVLAVSATHTVSLRTNTLRLGDGGAPTQNANVDLDDIRIISRTLSAGEVSNLFNKGVRNYRPVGLLGGEVLSYHPSRHDVGVLPDTVLQLDGSTGVTDQSPAGNDGTYNGGMGVTDGKFVLDGTDDYLSVPNAGEFSSGESFTVAARVKVSALPPFASSLVVKGYGSAGEDQPWWMLLLDGAGAVGLQTRNAAAATSTATGGDISDGEWHFVTGVYDAVANTLTTYVDASSVATAASVAAGAYGTNSSDLEVGGTHTSRWWGGELDEIRILNRALSATEVTNLYNNTITDESGNGNVGTLTGGAYIGENGEIVFDGVDDYVDCGNDSSLDVTSEITVSAWVKYDSFSTTPHVVGKLSTGPTNGYMLWTTTGGVATFSIAATTESTATSSALNTGTWYHLAGTYDGANVKLYVDGSLVDTTARAGAIGVASNNCRVGEATHTSVPLDGSVRHPQIFNRALTAAEVAFLASEHEVETPNTKGSRLSIVPSFDAWGNATLNALDFSGNGNVGTLTNMATGDWVADTDSGGTRALDFGRGG